LKANLLPNSAEFVQKFARNVVMSAPDMSMNTVKNAQKHAIIVLRSAEIWQHEFSVIHGTKQGTATSYAGKQKIVVASPA